MASLNPRKGINLMRKLLILALVFSAVGFSTPVFPADTCYEIRADGLACPYCAYGVEKKLMKIDAVKHVDFDLKKGLVRVTGEQDLALHESQLKTLFDDSGFSFRTLKKVKCKDE